MWLCLLIHHTSLITPVPTSTLELVKSQSIASSQLPRSLEPSFHLNLDIIMCWPWLSCLLYSSWHSAQAEATFWTPSEFWLPVESCSELTPNTDERTGAPCCHDHCSGFPSPTWLQGWSPKCGTLADRLVVLRGVPEVGFSSYVVPTYNLVSEYFGVQEPRLGVSAKGCSTRVQVFGDV